MATCAEMQAELDTLQGAYTQLMVSGTIVRARNGDKEVQFAPANIPLIQSRIGELKRLINASCGGTYSTRRIIRVLPT